MASVGPGSGMVSCCAGASSDIDVFLTMDRNLEYQQNIKVLDLGVVLVMALSNRMADLVPLAGQIRDAAVAVQPGEVRRVGY